MPDPQRDEPREGRVVRLADKTQVEILLGYVEEREEREGKTIDSAMIREALKTALASTPGSSGGPLTEEDVAREIEELHKPPKPRPVHGESVQEPPDQGEPGE